jgi:hypothetical protein
MRLRRTLLRHSLVVGGRFLDAADREVECVWLAAAAGA